MNRHDAILGCLLGQALGDAAGLWCEGMSPRRQRRFDPFQQRFLFGRGMYSDDAEHALMAAQALIVSGGEPQRFVRSLAWRLRGWLLGVPAGVGLATLRSIIKLWLGFSSEQSGVWSAGNGPAMRAPILGLAFGHDPDRLCELVQRSTRLTHVDPKAEWGARAIALAAHVSAHCDVTELATQYRTRLETELVGQTELLQRIDQAMRSAAAHEDTEAFAQVLGLGRGITGYMYHTVPVVIQAWLRHPRDFRVGVTAIIRCGGDTDTTAAILGGILGAGVGPAGLPNDWRDSLWEWPCGIAWIEQVAQRLAESLDCNTPLPAIRTNWPGVLLRNVLFACIVLGHGFRRLLPPW